MASTKILVIEDELNIRESLAELLELKDYDVITAENGQEGIIRAIQHLPNLIICDVMMPVFDGYQVLSLVRKNKNLANTPFLFLTAKASKEEIREGMSLGADDYLTKPFTSKELFSAIETRLSRSSDQDKELNRKLKVFSSQFSATSYHEINTPLTGVISTSQFLKENWREMKPNEVQEMLEIIVNSGNRLHRTFNNSLLGNQIMMARLSKDEKQLAVFAEGETQHPNELLQDVARTVARSYDRINDLTLSPIPTFKSIAIPQEYFKRILTEILDNAFKFSQKNSNVLCITKPKRDNFTILLTDKGRGFKTGSIRKIGPFQQFDREEHEQQGLGLGLFLAKSLTELNNGSFQIESEYGKQTTIVVTFNYK